MKPITHSCEIVNKDTYQFKLRCSEDWGSTRLGTENWLGVQRLKDGRYYTFEDKCVTCPECKSIIDADLIIDS